MTRRARLLTVILLAVAGISLMSYPALSNYINAIHSSRAVQKFTEQVDAAGADVLREERLLAEKYNRDLGSGALPDGYDRILDSGNGVMGYLTIPDIGVELSIYHGVSDTVLQKGVGHLPTSALPIGGSGSHCVLTGHTGLPSAELFTDLTELEPGDRFFLHVLDQVLVYQVDQITVVLPYEMDALGPERGRDYCTLVTCTPYGINSHRLLVRGERVPTEAEPALLPQRVGADAPPGMPWELILAGIALAVLLTAAIAIALRPRKI